MIMRVIIAAALTSIGGCGGFGSIEIVSVSVLINGEPLPEDVTTELEFPAFPSSAVQAPEIEISCEFADPIDLKGTKSVGVWMSFDSSEGVHYHGAGSSLSTVTEDGRKLKTLKPWRLPNPCRKANLPAAGYDCILTISLRLESGDVLLWSHPIKVVLVTPPPAVKRLCSAENGCAQDDSEL